MSEPLDIVAIIGAVEGPFFVLALESALLGFA